MVFYCALEFVVIVMVRISSRFYTYGDLPLESHLENIENKVLHHFNKISVATDIPHEPRWLEPVSRNSNDQFAVLLSGK